MALRFSCPKCGYKLSAPVDCAGRSSKCRACGQPVTVPVSPVPRKRSLWVVTAVLGAAVVTVTIVSSLVALVLVGFGWRAPENRVVVAGKKENNPAVVDLKKNAPEKQAEDPKTGKETKVEKPVGLKPGKPVDEKEVVVPTKKKFNNRNVNETAEWVIARTLEINQQSNNAFRRKNELKAFDEQMKALVAKDVEWRFTVRDILEENIRLYQTWSTIDGSRYPDDPANRLFKSKSLIILPRFRVSFYHEGRELFDRIDGPTGGDGMRGRISEPGTSLARQMWSDDGLVISDEIGDKQAAALKPNDVIIVNAKIRAFRFEDDLLSTGFPSDCAVCILEAKKTDEWKRHVAEQRERAAKKNSKKRSGAIK
jgi:hypothetical protein